MVTGVYDALLAASYKGVPFLVEGSDLSAGKKYVVHEYPNQNVDVVEELGMKMRVFTMRAIISGPEYFLKRTALIVALSFPGAGLLIHPYYGAIYCTALDYTITEESAAVGECRLNITFHETSLNIFPTFIGESISGLGDIAAAVQGLCMAGLEDRVKSTSAENKDDINNKLQKLHGEVTEKVLSPTVLNNENYNVFNSEANKFDANTSVYAANSTKLAQGVFDLLATYNAIGSTDDFCFELNKKIFDFGDDDKTINADTTIITERTICRLALNANAKAIVFCNMCFLASKIIYLDTVKLNLVVNFLIEKFDDIIINNNFNEETAAGFENLFYRTKQYLSSLKINDVIIVTTAPISITNLLYNYYENFDNENEIISLNDITKPSLISGDIQILRIEE